MRTLGLAAGLALLTFTLPVSAQDAIPSHPALTDSFYFGLGAFVPKTSTSAQVDSSTLGAGANIDFERAFGMETQKTVPDAFARWRFSDRWRVEAEYFDLNRNGDKVLTQDITWNGVTYTANTEVVSKFNFNDVRASVGYSLFKRKDKEIGVAFGFHIATYNVGVSAAGKGNDTEKILAPLPVFSAYGQFALTDEWAVGGRLDRFSMSYDKYDGNITSMGVDLNYQPFRHMGFGLAYRSLFITFKYAGPGYNATFNQTFQGPLLYLNGSF